MKSRKGYGKVELVVVVVVMWGRLSICKENDHAEQQGAGKCNMGTLAPETEKVGINKCPLAFLTFWDMYSFKSQATTSPFPHW
jgi:hypothetical protein